MMKERIFPVLLINLILPAAIFAGPLKEARVVSPNGGQNFYKGTTIKISWRCTPGEADGRLFLARLKGEVITIHNFVIKPASTAQNEINWKIPSDIPDGSDYKIGLEVNYGKTKLSDYSDRFFSIKSIEIITEVAAPRRMARIRVISPNGGETIYKEQNFLIEWETPDPIGYPRIAIQQGESFVFDMHGVHPEGPFAGNRYRYNWRVPGEIPNDTNYKLRVQAADMFGWDDSDRVFTITNQRIEVTSPRDGVRWRRGSTQTITFNAFNITQNLKVWVDGLNPAYTIAQNLPPGTTSVVWADVPVVNGVVPGGNSVRVVVSTMDLSVKGYSGWIQLID